MTANDSEWSFRLKFFFCKQSSVGMIILKTKRSFLITPEVNANISSTCIQNLCKFIHSLSLDVPFAYLCINDPRELRKRYPQLTTVFKSKATPVQFTFCSYEAIRFIFRIYSFQIYNFRIQINVGASGATDVIKYLKLSKITNFLRVCVCVCKIVVFYNFHW